MTPTAPEYLYEDPIIIPRAISKDKTLTLQAKYFYGLLVSQSLCLDVCIDTNKSLADQCGVQPRAVQLWLRSLLTKGYISISYDSDQLMRLVDSKRPVRAIKPLVVDYSLDSIHEMQEYEAGELGVQR
jgi:hypothetical protein